MKITPAQLGSVRPLQGGSSGEQQVAEAEHLRDAYRQFVGKTFFGQLLKSMRSTVGKPAYFHGGQTEEAFRSQLDNYLADGMTESSASRIADPMFRQQFPGAAQTLAKQDGDGAAASKLADLTALRRR